MIRKLFLVAVVAVTSIQLSMAQERTVTGTVRSDEGETLPGANVVLKGSTTGTSTDMDGKYSITVPGNDAVLVISFVGMQPREEKVGARAVVDASLSIGVQLKEFVVDALGFEKEKDKTGSASSTIGSNQLKNTGDARLINSMAGKTAGVNIVQSTGEPGAGSKIQVRGATSILGDLQPLIVVDGIPMFNDSYYGEGFGGNQAGSAGSVGSGGGVSQQSRMNDINPNDIESMEILRGAAAAALWGSRAANGVIVITTKKGKAAPGGQKFSVDVNSSIAIDQINREVPLNFDYGNGFSGFFVEGTSLSWGDKIANRKGGSNDVITDPNDPNYGGYFTAESGNKYYRVRPAFSDPNNPNDVHGGKNSTETYDPYDMYFKNGTTINNSVAITAADNNGSVYFSFADMRQDGIILNNSNYIRDALRLNITRYLTEKWTLNANIGYTRTTADRVQMGSNLSGLFLGGLRNPADFNPEDYFGTYTNASGATFTDRQRAYRNPRGASANSIYDNPFFVMNNIRSQSTVNRVLGKLELGYDVNKWLNILWRNGIDYYSDNREDYFPVQSAGENNGGRFTNEIILSSQFNSDLIARMKWKINDDIVGNAIIGTNLNARSVNDHGTTVRNFVNPFSPPTLTNGSLVQGLDNSSQQNSQSVYASFSAELYSQLYINATLRSDWLSTLPTTARNVTYPAADVAWDFTKYIKKNDYFTFGKLRAGFGQVGRGPDPYSLKTYYFAPTAANFGFGDTWGSGLNPISYGGGFAQSSTAGNPDIRPEIKTEWEVGTDLRFWKNRVTLAGTYYNNVTKDLIVSVDVPQSSGYVTQFANAAEITNKGFEIELGADVIKKDDFVWNVYGNYTKNQNEVTAMAGTEQITLAGFSSGASAAVVGQPLGALWGGRWERDASGSLVVDANGYPTMAEQPGVIGDPNPDFRAGMGTNLFYKGFSMNMLFDMSRGMQMWNGTRGALAFFGRAEGTSMETTFSAEEANTIKNYDGFTIAEYYPYLQNTDGSYTIRGEMRDLAGNGQEVLVDEAWYLSGPGSGFTGPDEQFVEDASWTRLRELTISYTLDSDKFIEKTKLQAVTLSFTGRNLMLWTNYQGNDPDQSLNGPGNNGFGLDYFQNPSTKSYMFALNVRF